MKTSAIFGNFGVLVYFAFWHNIFEIEVVFSAEIKYIIHVFKPRKNKEKIIGFLSKWVIFGKLNFWYVLAISG